jgi:uncharacterized protein YggE
MKEKFERQLQVGGWVLIALFVLGGYWLWQNIDQLRHAGNSSDVITVSGTGKMTAKPDVAVANLAISVEGTTAKGAQDDANVKSKAVVDYLKTKDIDAKDIRTSGYNISPLYDYTNGKSRIRGYQVTQTLEVKIRNLDKANDILDGVVAAGVNEVNNLRFTIDDPDKLKSQAREKAIADAHAKAEELRRQLGVDLGRIVTFSEYSDSSPIMYGRGMDSAKMMSGAGIAPTAAVPELPAGENEIVINVSITYQIK